MTATANTTHHPGWDWDGKMYPKTKRSQGPSMDGLEKHSQVLLLLIHIAPNAYPDAFRLRDLLMELHGKFRIFLPDGSEDSNR